MTTRAIDEARLASWLNEQGRVLQRLEPLPGDVSPRRYARVELGDGSRAIAAGYTVAMAGICRRFEATTELLERASIPVPRILASDCDRGLALLEDVGPETLYDLRRRPLPERLPYFIEAVTIARRIAEMPSDPVARLGQDLDTDLLRSELEQTLEVYLSPRGLLGARSTQRAMEIGLTELCEALGRAPLVPCHRDFMCRNLVPRPPAGLIVLDHQDLRLGPPSYDLAALLNDSFFPAPEIESLLLDGALADEEAQLGYHRAAAQRCLKAVGTFAAFAARGFERHLPLIPPILARALRHLGLVPETEALPSELEELWAPVIAGAAAEAEG